MNPLYYLLPLLALAVVGLGAVAIFVFNVGGGDEDAARKKPKEPPAEREPLPCLYGHDVILVWGRAVWTGFFVDTTTDEHISSDELGPEALKLPTLMHQ